MRPIIQPVNQDDVNKPKIVVNENGLAVLKKVVLEAEAYLSYQRMQNKAPELPSKFVSGQIDKVSLELVLVHPEVDPADPAQQQGVVCGDDGGDRS
jgi:hypothetical protein